MDISALYNVNSGAIKQAADSSAIGQRVLKSEDQSFDSVLSKAMDHLNTTNSYISDYENEEVKWMLGETQNTHDLTVAMNKASVALEYTVAIRTKIIEAYKELMQIQI